MNSVILMMSLDNLGNNKTGGMSSSPSVRFQDASPSSNLDADEEARLRRGAVPENLKKQIATRSVLGRAAVNLTNDSFSRSKSEASIFRSIRPTPEPASNDEPSVTLWQSGYTTLSRAKSTSSVISGLNDDVLRAGWRRNEPGPYWEQAHELEPDRQATVVLEEEAQGDGFDFDEMDFDDPPTNSSATNPQDLASLIDDEDKHSTSEAVDCLGELNPTLSQGTLNYSKRKFAKTQSMPVGGTFGTRPDQPKFYREFDDSFMRMDVEF